VRRAAVLTAAALLVVGCGGKETAPPATTGPTPDYGRIAITALIEAAARHDAAAMWELLSQPSRRRAGPTLEAFRRREARALERALAPLVEGKPRVLVSERINDRFGLVAVVRGSHAFAVPLRREGGAWTVELPGPLTIEVLGPDPGSRGEKVAQIGVEVHGGGGAGDAVLYLDGVTLQSRAATGPKSATVFADLASPLEPGLHTAVAFATRGGNAAARAWTFVAV